jgi:hypothetical protein
VAGRERWWNLVSTVTGLLASLLAQRLLRLLYETVRRDSKAPSPFDPANTAFSWTEVVMWSAAAGIGLGLTKVVSARLAALGWEAATGSRPPLGVQDASAG